MMGRVKLPGGQYIRYEGSPPTSDELDEIIDQIESVPSKIVKTVLAPYKAGEEFDIKSPSSIMSAGKTVALDPAGSLEFIQGLENKVLSAKSSALGNLLREGKVPESSPILKGMKIPGQDYPVTRGLAAGAFDIGSDIAFGTQGVLGAIGVPSPKVKLPFGFMKEVNAPAQDIAEREGFRLPLESRIESEGLKREVNRLSKSVGGKGLQKDIQQGTQGLYKFGKKVIHEISGGKEIPDSLEVLDKSPAEYFKKVKNVSDGLYSKVPGDSPAISESSKNTIQNTIQFLYPSSSEQIPEAYRTAYMEATGKEILPSQMEQKLLQEPGRVNVKDIGQQLNKTFENLSSEKIKFGDLKRERMKFGLQIDWGALGGGDYINKIRKSIYFSLTEDMNASAAASGFEKEARDANSHFRNFKNAIELNDNLEASKTYGKFSPQRLASRLGKMSDDEIKSRFGVHAQKVLDLKEVSNAMASRTSGAMLDPLSFTKMIPRKIGSNILASPETQDFLLRGKIPTLPNFYGAGFPRLSELSSESSYENNQ